MSEQEKKDKRFSIVVSAIIHSSLVALFLILVAWRAPDPPIPEYGIELNLGFQEAGSGDTERTAETLVEDTEQDTPPDAENETENNESDEAQEEVEEEVVEETKPVTPPVQQVKEETKPVEQTVKEAVKTPEKTEVKVEEKTPPVTETKKETTTPPKEEKKVEEKPKEEPKPKPVVDNRALMGGKKSNTDNKDNSSNNQGTQIDTRGNMGDPSGKPNTTGSDPGGENAGVSLSLEGWKWKAPPGKKDDSQVDGVIIFSFDVDDRGKVSNVAKIQGSTIQDNLVVQFYKKQVEELTFVLKDQSAMPKNKSTGRITFVIKTN